MANTFRTLCDLADWSPLARSEFETPTPPEKVESTTAPESKAAATPPISLSHSGTGSTPLQLHYNIQIILPESRDQAVYDALFASLKKHLL